ncbi:MAG: GDYXXLXY domain-containing protein [Oscillatoriaceae cyanobacterium Prado104]|jgi:uncharacterized membrane-anchored protein|nr:GDYXXLXY domain-containing protein [Oscillatoriaceae cyanobacterium Prado104]
MNAENQDLTTQNPAIANPSENRPSFTLPPEAKRLPAWRMWGPLLLQIGLIVAIPAQAVYTFVTGRTVILQTAPVDPYDFLRGYYQVLSYNISSSEDIKKLPGWKDLPKAEIACPVGADCRELEKNQYLKQGASFYVVLEAPKDAANSGRPKAWKPVFVSLQKPANLPADRIAIKGRYNGWRMEYGLETYYMPEQEREKVNREITQAQRGQRQSFVVEVKVDNTGHAVPVSLWVADRNYRF